LNISETTRDRVIVIIERQYEVICALSHGYISNDLDGPITRFQGHGILEVEYLKNGAF